MMRLLLFPFILFCFAFELGAQNSVLQNQEKIFVMSEAQLMCRLVNDKSSRVIVKPGEHHWDKPRPGDYTLLDFQISLSKDECNQFESLIFPDASAGRFYRLASLCDLYFPLFAKKISAKGIHRDLRWLPVVLSGCNSSFKSTNGRAGLWAMDYLSGRKQHLRIDKYIDERCGGDFTTDAALTQFREILTSSNENYLQALVAYISGITASKELEGMSSQESITAMSESCRMQIKLMAYVKALMESARIDNKLQAYFDVFAELEGVTTESDISFRAMTEIIGVTDEELNAWNPVYVGGIVLGGYRKIPFMLNKKAAAGFINKRDSLIHWSPKIVIAESAPVVEYANYRVKKGDTLGKLANRYGVTESELKKINGMKTSTLVAGKIIRVPEKKSSVPPMLNIPEYVSPPADSIPAAVDTTKKVSKSVQPSADTKTAGDKSHKIIYVVKSGDSLWKIARKYKGVTEQELKKWNKVGDRLVPGQKLVIYPE